MNFWYKIRNVSMSYLNIKWVQQLINETNTYLALMMSQALY